MGIARGPNVINDGLVFGYDTGYNDSGKQLASGRFFKGPSHSNLLKGHTNSQSSQTTNYSFVYGTQEVEIPEVGVRTVKYCDYNNNRYAADGSVNSGTSCCPNLFYYHGSSPYVPVSANTSYTYSIIYKHTAGYTHPNFMYRYEYDDTTYVKEGGLHSTASDRRRNLGDGWYHAWGTFTTASTTTNLRCYSFLYNYGLQTDRFYVAGISIVQNQGGGTHFIIPPQLMLEPLGSVSDTASLIDLKRTLSIDVGDVSFDSNAQPEFDGTDDYILYSSTKDVGTVFTVNFWIKPNGKQRQTIVSNGYPYQTNKGFFIACPGNTTNSDSFFLSLGADDNYVTAANGSLTQGVWQMVTCRVNGPGNLMKLYVNGIETNYSHQDNGNTTLQYDTGDFLTGRRTLASSDFLESPVSCIQMYNRALTEEEIQQNYKAFKNRFNI